MKLKSGVAILLCILEMHTNHPLEVFLSDVLSHTPLHEFVFELLFTSEMISFQCFKWVVIKMRGREQNMFLCPGISNINYLPSRLAEEDIIVVIFGGENSSEIPTYEASKL